MTLKEITNDLCPVSLQPFFSSLHPSSCLSNFFFPSSFGCLAYSNYIGSVQCTGMTNIQCIYWCKSCTPSQCNILKFLILILHLLFAKTWALHSYYNAQNDIRWLYFSANNLLSSMGYYSWNIQSWCPQNLYLFIYLYLYYYLRGFLVWIPHFLVHKCLASLCLSRDKTKG